MFTPLPMQYVTIYLMRDDALEASLALAECGVFNPETVELEHDPMPERPGRRYQELFRSARVRLDRIADCMGLPIDEVASDRPAKAVALAELEKVTETLGEISKECVWCEDTERRLNEETRDVQQLNSLLDKYEALDIDLDLLHGKLRFLDVHIGSVSAGDVLRLRQALGLIGYSLTAFSEADGTAYVVVAGLRGVGQELQNVLQAASFRPLDLPVEFRGHPRELRGGLQDRARKAEAGREQLRQKLEEARREYREPLLTAARTLAWAAPYAELADALRSMKTLASVSGWVPQDQVGRLHEVLQQRLAHPVLLQARDPLPAERARVPSVMRYPDWLRPFAALVRNYGVPRYGEIDPTWLFALTFVAMFGMMFGDVGHGAVIAAAGLGFRRALRGFAPFVTAAGVSSVLFGILYGSVFGYEGLVHSVWMSPLADPMRMLQMALFWGIGFIILATGITVRNRLAEGHYAEALLDGRGVAGILLYGAVLFAAYRWIATASFGLLEQLGLAATLAVVLGYRWYEYRAPFGERVLVVLIEGFETLMSYIANTLSFLRVAAFSLNHVALAIAVFTLADMMGPVGHWTTVVLGNVFILVLEGAIVAIQVLRLEYYEGFSRFFRGDGREFRPLKLATL